uniref:Reverse transcriptase domain-containing protein n=1 Tax=Knipowitschia caucasica TaxID=637954 RepID=A0AAV2LKW6_KNICA
MVVPLYKKGDQKGVFQLLWDHTPQPSRRSSVVFIPATEHWTSSILSIGSLSVHGSSPPTGPHVFVDLEKVFDRVLRDVLWGVLQEYGVFCLRALRALYDRSRAAFASAMQEGVRFGDHRISSPLFADDVVLLAPRCLALSRWVERSFLKEFKYLGVLFTSEGRMESEIDRRIGAVMRSR